MTRQQIILAVLSLAACDSAGPTGLAANLRVAGAQFVDGDLPEVTPDAPTVTFIGFGYTVVSPGTTQHHLQGRVGVGGQAVAVQLANDLGYWIIPGGVIDIVDNSEVTFDAQLSYSPTAPLGKTQLLFSAVDQSGHFGPRQATDITFIDDEPIQPIDVRLTWDSESDLDLHVEFPDRSTIWTYQRTSRLGGVLDFDSNANCVIDGRREENVNFAMIPPAGTYVVRVDAATLCGQPAARWKVEVLSQGTVISQASGPLGPEATRGAHDASAGILALTFEVQ